MKAEYSRIVPSTLLFASAGIGAIILRFDNVLWFYAQPHAIGLVFFVLIDVLFAILLIAKPIALYLLVGAWGAIKFVLMIGNLFFGTAFGVDCEGMQFNQQDLRDYLMGSVQNAPPDYGFYRVSPYTYLISSSIQPIISGIAFILYRQHRGEQVPAVNPDAT